MHQFVEHDSDAYTVPLACVATANTDRDLCVCAIASQEAILVTKVNSLGVPVSERDGTYF